MTPQNARVYKKLDELLPKRNFLVHGETHEVAFKGKPKQPYRVGIIKKDLDYLDQFDRGEHGANIFDLDQVKARQDFAGKLLQTSVHLDMAPHRHDAHLSACSGWPWQTTRKPIQCEPQRRSARTFFELTPMVAYWHEPSVLAPLGLVRKLGLS